MNRTTTSRILSWTIRILVVFIVFILIGLGLMSMISGNSESHRKNLELAFSDMLKAEITIGSLEQFNIMPQLAIKASDIKGSYKESGNRFRAGKIDIAFSFYDLALGRPRIEILDIADFKMEPGSAYDFGIEKAGVGDAGLSVRGEFEKKAFDFVMPLEKDMNGTRPAYAFGEKAPFKGHFGALEMTGLVAANGSGKGSHFENIALLSGGRAVAKGRDEKQADAYKIVFTCTQEKVDDAVKSDLAVLRKISFVALPEQCGQ